MFDQIIRGNPIGTSTVVYDFARHAAQRFKVEFTNAGEDYLFWMQLVRSGARIAFSSRSQAQYGKGVNIYWIDSHHEGVARDFLNEALEAMRSANWFDKSDISTDYFYTAYYVDISVGRYDKPYEVAA